MSVNSVTHRRKSRKQNIIPITMLHEVEYTQHNEIEEKRDRLSKDFDFGLLTFNYKQIKRTGVQLTNLTWCKIMMRAIEQVLQMQYSMNANRNDVTHTLRAAHEVTSGLFSTIPPQELTEAFFEGRVPMELSILEEFGIKLSARQREQLKHCVIYDLMMEGNIYD